MIRTLAALAVLTIASSAHAQGVLNRAGQALDNAGRNIRRNVEGAVARGEALAQERDLAGLVSTRIRSDKRLAASALQMEVRADGTVVLRGSVSDPAAKRVAVDLVENTIGVTTVVDELALVKDVKVIEARPAARPVVVKPAVPADAEVIVKPDPAGAEVIVKPAEPAVVRP